SSVVARAPTSGKRPSNQRTNAGDAAHPGDGVWLVGTAAANRVIVSGTYETTVPAGSPGCTWSRIALNHTIITTRHANRGQPASHGHGGRHRRHVRHQGLRRMAPGRLMALLRGSSG